MLTTSFQPCAYYVIITRSKRLHPYLSDQQLHHIRIKLAPAAGLEPATIRVTTESSTIELDWNEILAPTDGFEPPQALFTSSA